MQLVPFASATQALPHELGCSQAGQLVCVHCPPEAQQVPPQPSDAPQDLPWQLGQGNTDSRIVST
jgi:hypothetical protein